MYTRQTKQNKIDNQLQPPYPLHFRNLLPIFLCISIRIDDSLIEVDMDMDMVLNIVAMVSITATASTAALSI